MSSLQLISTVTPAGQLSLSLASAEIPEPAADEVTVQMQACPINPSDLGSLLAFADINTARASTSNKQSGPVTLADIPSPHLPALKARFDHPLPTGGEGAGLVVKAGASPAAQALLGKTVALWGGATYSQYRTLALDNCLVLPEGIAAAKGASSFVNPLTVLGMVETLRNEGHTALVHTAAASNLGQMLIKHCLAEDIELVNIVRQPEHVSLLKKLGATYVCDSSAPGFKDELIQAIAATGATLGFDAIGGGELASTMLHSMEQALMLNSKTLGGYGTAVHKQVYVYGGLDLGPTTITRSFGMAWGMGGWLLPNFLAKIGPQATQALKEKVAAEITTTFASHYTQTLSLAEALEPGNIKQYGRRATGEKYLINPNKGLL